MSANPTDPSADVPPAGGPATVAKPQVTKGQKPARRPDLDTLFSINPDGSRNAIHPADVHGRFQRRKNLLWTVLIAIYLAMPWLTVDGRPAILIDIQKRHFFLFGQTFNAQDFWLAFFFISGMGFTLFVVAALFGRVWCGYACPHTVFLEGVFRRLERWIEGPGPARQKLEKAPLSPGKVLRRGGKLLVFLLVAAVITHSFLGYFMPVRDVVRAMTTSPSENMTAFLFVAVATFLLFVNFTWFREQTCIVVCPYGRLQGVLYDPDTLLVGYDQKRGEPRGAHGEGHGDCVDCFRCVAVCPTGIDIRNGTQLECVGCANCIDACDAVMEKLGRPQGLVRYDSQRGFTAKAHRFFRPRVVLYAIMLVVGVCVFAFAATHRRQFEANLIRSSANPFVLEQGRVKNVFNLHLINKLPVPSAYTIEIVQPKSPAGEVTVAQTQIELASFQDVQLPVMVFFDPDKYRRGDLVKLVVSTTLDGQRVAREVQGPLLGPVLH